MSNAGKTPAKSLTLLLVVKATLIQPFIIVTAPRSISEPVPEASCAVDEKARSWGFLAIVRTGEA